MEILRYRAINKGAVVGSFDVRIPKWGVIINDCTLFEKDGRRWISFPSKPYESEGQKKYFPMIQFVQKDHMAKFTEAVMPLLYEAMKKEQAPEPNSDGVPF